MEIAWNLRVDVKMILSWILEK